MTLEKKIWKSDLNINDGNLVVADTHGINFSVTANAGNSASMESELFEDYEWGSWVPENQYQAVASRRDCRYIKVGDMVTVSFDITAGSANPDSSQTGGYIEGLPFTSINSSPGGRPGVLKIFDSYNGAASSLTTECWMYCNAADTTLFIQYNSQNRVLIRAESSSKRIMAVFTYLAA